MMFDRVCDPDMGISALQQAEQSDAHESAHRPLFICVIPILGRSVTTCRSLQQVSPSTNMTDEEAIRDLQRKWFQATMSGEVATIGELMTDDVLFLTPGRAPFGRNEFFESFKAMTEHVTIECDGDFLEIMVDGDLAFATARLNITVTPKNSGAAKHLAGNTLSVFARQADGRWQLSRDANLVTPRST
jgi:uncharacterized protein (TIGR02246 family)